MPSQRVIMVLIVLAIGYLVGAKFPGLAGKIGLV